MRNLLTKVRLQPLALLGGYAVPKLDDLPAKQLKDVAGNTYVSINRVVSGAVDVSIAPLSENHLFTRTFSSVPIVWQSEINQEYQELGEALGEMTQLDEGDEWKVDVVVYQVACQVAAELLANSFPAPRIFNHGPKSVVFNWSRGNNNLYLTISSDYISALVSSPERIKRRIEFSTKDMREPALVFRGLLSEQPVVSTSKATSQVSGFVE